MRIRRRLDSVNGEWRNSQIIQAERTENGKWTYIDENNRTIDENTLVKDLEVEDHTVNSVKSNSLTKNTDELKKNRSNSGETQVSPSVNAVKNTTLEKHIRSSASQAPQDQPVVQTSQPSKTATSTAKIVNSEEQKSPNGVKVLPSVDDATVPLVSTGLEKHIRSGPTQVGSSSLAPNSSLASTMSKLEKNIGSSSTDAKVSESQTEQTSKIATNKNSEQQLPEEAVIGGNGVKDDDSAASSTQSNSCCSISELIAGCLFVLILLCLFAILPKLAEYWDDYLDKDSESEDK
jgi:hypothetical protein